MGAGNEENKYSWNIATINNGTFTDATFTMSGVQTYFHDQPISRKHFFTRYYYSSSVSQSNDDWYSSSFQAKQLVPQDEFLGLANSFHDGCKMTSDDFNIDSTDTIDGGPVVEFTVGNPNTLISKEDGFSGELDVR